MNTLHAGLTSVDITPPLGVPMAGYAGREHPAQAVETPLTAHALVIEDGNTSAAMAFTDLIGVTPDVVAGVREMVASETDIPADAVMLSGSHTHWGPVLRAESYVSSDLNDRVLEEYLQCLIRTLGGALVAAWRERVPAAAGWGTGVAQGISFNRRPVSVDGSVAMSLKLEPEQAMLAADEGLRMRREWRYGGHGGPRLSPPLDGLQGLRAGVTDPEIPFLKLLREDGSPLAGVVNFACHPVVGGDDNYYSLSPDYPGEARGAFCATVGTPLVFAYGCAGDQVPAWRGGDSRVRVGRSLGAGAAQAWYQVETCAREVTVATARRPLSLDIKDLTLPEGLAGVDVEDSPHRRQLEHLARRYEGCRAIETEIWGVRVGDWAAVGLPGEVLVEIGLQIKQRSPFPITAVISLCNDSVGYISTANAHQEGGYEPGWSAPGPAAETQLVDAALDLLAELREGGQTR